MTAQINKIDADLLKFIIERGKTGITRLELKRIYPMNENSIILSITKLQKHGLVSVELCRSKEKNGVDVVTKLITAKIKQ